MQNSIDTKQKHNFNRGIRITHRDPNNAKWMFLNLSQKEIRQKRFKIFAIWAGGVVEKATTSFFKICCIDFRGIKLGQKLPWHRNIFKTLDLGVRLPLIALLVKNR